MADKINNINPGLLASQQIAAGQQHADVQRAPKELETEKTGEHLPKDRVDLDEQRRMDEGEFIGAAGALGKGAIKKKTDADEVDSLTLDLSGEEAAGARGRGKTGKKDGSTATFHVEQELAETFGAISGDTATAVVHPTDGQINGQKIQATYLHATHDTADSPVIYADPVNTASVDQIFAPLSPKAAQALPQVRAMQLAPVPGSFGEPLDIADIAKPIFLEDPLHGIAGFSGSGLA